MVTAFIDRVHPDAICIERPPAEAARNDFYEFTYEVQGIVLPYAAAHRTELCPVDWMPPVEDQKLGFGRDLDVPPEIRPKGPQGFVFFPDPKSLKADIFAADDPATMQPITNWASKQPERADKDFPRRLYLYRTFLQAELIRAAARKHSEGTLLVVIGAFHKPDIEAILSHDEAIDLEQPSAIGRPSIDEAERATTSPQRVAVLSFNLLGLQAQTGNVDWDWMQRTVHALATPACTPECQLFRVRLDQLTGKISADSAMRRYRELIAATPPDVTFSWTGVKDTARLDSYFDPFGNLSVRQRATLELVRVLRAIGAAAEATSLLDKLKHEIGERKGRQLNEYAIEYLKLEPRDLKVRNTKSTANEGKRMKHKWTVLFAALLTGVPVSGGGSPKPNYAFQNGRWWDGSGYKQGALYSVGGILSSEQPTHVDHIFALHGGYVIPPLAEGHNHWLEPSKVDDYNACYLADGVYYVRDMGNVPFLVDQFRDKVNLPTSVDWTSATPPFTGLGADPVEIIDQFVQFGILPKDWKPD
jgi:hypothetical protein